MKTLTTLIITLTLMINICTANDFNYKLTISNVKYTSDRSIEFDIQMINISKTEIPYYLGQYFLEFNPEIANGGILKYSIVQSGLPQEFEPRNPSVDKNLLRLSCNSISGNKDNLPLIAKSQGTLIVRMKLETTADNFSNESLNLKWTDSECKFKTKIFTFKDNQNYEITNPDFHEVDNNTHEKLNAGTTIPDKFSLSQNYPNPFNPSTKIKFDIPANALSATGMTSVNVSLILFDITGRQVSTIVNSMLQAGSYEVSFDGSSLSSGVYFYKLSAGRYSETMRMLLIK